MFEYKSNVASLVEEEEGTNERQGTCGIDSLGRNGGKKE